MAERVLIFDTTLRDGEQSPGYSMNTKEKLELARQLARLGVDIIEAGFPIASVDDFEAVKAVAQQLKGGPIIAGLCRAKDVDIDRYRVGVPLVNVISIGAGGGSIAWIDGQGLLHVGPQSAEAVPGPACYMRGGTEATVTDALVVLGYLNQSALLGGRMPIDAHRARAALQTKVAAPLGLSEKRYSNVIVFVNRCI